MTLYVDTSALLKRYVDEADSDRFNGFLTADETWLTSRPTCLEVWRNLGARLGTEAVRPARTAFGSDWARFLVFEVDASLVEQGGRIADATGVRSLDALHLASLQRAGPAAVSLLTADIRQVQAARMLGWTVLGA